ncbi:hypothetical protein J4407_02220 [Candidatus Pacearchaeota archaeon]|nr:hypothetical protein [Candidatus Pacearchaeota archaeon]
MLVFSVSIVLSQEDAVDSVISDSIDEELVCVSCGNSCISSDVAAVSFCSPPTNGEPICGAENGECIVLGYEEVELEEGSCADGEVYDFFTDSCSLAEEIELNVEPPGFLDFFTDRIKIILADENTKAELVAEVTAKRIVAFEDAIEAGDYAAARNAAEDIRQGLGEGGRYIEEFGPGPESYSYEDLQNGRGAYYDFYHTKGLWVQTIDMVSEGKNMLLAKVESGEISQEDADRILREISEGEVSPIIAFEKKQDEIIDYIYENSQGEVTKLEIEMGIASNNEKTGLETYYQVPFSDIAYDKYVLDAYYDEISNSPDLEFRDVTDYYETARLNLQFAENAMVNGDYEDAYTYYHECSYLIDAIGNYVDDGTAGLQEFDEDVANIEEINREIEEESLELFNDYTTLKEEGKLDDLEEENPGLVAELEAQYSQAEEIVNLQEKIDSEFYDARYESLIQDGMSEEEAKAKMEEVISESYYYISGGKYFPVGYVDISENEEGGLVYEYSGGFPKSMNIRDDANEITFRFGNNGYSWTDPLTGERYTNSHPGDYDPMRIQHGDEVFTNNVETSDGTYTYEYTMFGYKITEPDGTETEIVYGNTAASTQFVGGSIVTFSPFGADITSQGQTTRWTGNPVFGNMIDIATGKYFNPDVSHMENAVYNEEEGVYEYAVGPNLWKFNPETNVFSNEDGTVETSIPTIPEMPIGKESEEIILDDGTEWNFNDADETWEKTTADGTVEEFVPAPNNYYISSLVDPLFIADEEGSSYVDVYGKVVEEVIFDDRGWKQNELGNWVSEEGYTYYPQSTEVVGSGLNYGKVYDNEGNIIKENTVSGGKYIWDPATRANRWVPIEGLLTYDPANPSKYEVADADGGILATWIQNKDGRWQIEGSGEGEGYYGYENYRRDFTDYSGVSTPTGTTFTAPGREGGGVYTKTEDGWLSPYGYTVGTPPGYGSNYGYYSSYYSGGNLASIGTSVVVEGKTYTVTAEKGWTDENGNAVPPPPGHPSSVVGVMGYDYRAPGDYGYGYEYTPHSGGYNNEYYGYGANKNYNYIENGEAYYFPPGVDPLSVVNKESYKITDAYGYDPAFGTDFGAPTTQGRDYYSYYGGSYGHVKDSTTGEWRQATKEEAEVAMTSNDPNFSPPGGWTTAYSGGYNNFAGGYYSYSSAGGYFDSSGNYVSGGDYTGGGGYDSSGNYVGGEYGGYDSSGNYVGGESYTYNAETGTYSYTGGSTGSGSGYGYTGGSYPGSYGGYYDSSGNYVSGGSYPGYYGGYYDSSTGSYVGATGCTGGACPVTGEPYGSYSGGYYDSSGNYVSSGSYSGGYYDSSGNYVSGGSYSGGYYDSSGNYVSGGSYSGGYDSATGTYGYYSGGSYYTGGGGYDSSGNYVGGEYGGYDSSGTYTGGETYSGSESTTTSDGSTSSSTTTSDSGGGDSSGGTTGGVVAEIKKGEQLSLGDFLRDFFNNFFSE